MDGPSPWAKKKYTKNVAAFGRLLPTVRARGEQAVSMVSSRNTIRKRKETIMTRSTIAKTFTIAAVTALALGLAPTAKANDKGCSNATLKGAFARTDQGFVIPPNSAPMPLA